MTADTVIDNQYDTQGWNRYSYVKNNPIVYKDPTGHEAQPMGLDLSKGWSEFRNNVVNKVNNAYSSAKNNVTEKLQQAKDFGTRVVSQLKEKAINFDKDASAPINTSDIRRDGRPTKIETNIFGRKEPTFGFEFDAIRTKADFWKNKIAGETSPQMRLLDRVRHQNSVAHDNDVVDNNLTGWPFVKSMLTTAPKAMIYSTYNNVKDMVTNPQGVINSIINEKPYPVKEPPIIPATPRDAKDIQFAKESLTMLKETLKNPPHD